MKNRKNIIFGSFDGVTSVLGVEVALLTKAPHDIFPAALGLGISSLVGMGAGEYLGDHNSNIGSASVMGLSTFFGIIIPPLPFIIWSGIIALLISIIITIIICIVIGHLRDKGLRGYIEAFGTLLLAGGLTILFTFLTGAG